MRAITVQIEITGCEHMTEAQVVEYLNADIFKGEDFKITSHGSFFTPNASRVRKNAFGEDV